MSGEKVRESGLPILGRIVSYAVTGVDPSVMGIGPVSACRTALSRAGWTLDDVDLIEANEPLPPRRWRWASSSAGMNAR